MTLDELALLEAEAALAGHLTTLRLAAGPTHRLPHPHEITARVKFGVLDELVTNAVADITSVLDTVRDTTLREMSAYLDALHQPTPWAVLDALTRLTDPTTPGVLDRTRDAVAKARDDIRGILAGLAADAAREARDEARRQGARIPPPIPRGAADAIDAACAAHASRTAQAPVARALTVAVDAATRAATPGASGTDVAAEAVKAATGASPAGAEDTARQAANTAHGMGRTEQLKTAEEPAEVYASELLDRNTCKPCSHVDGRTYESMAEALKDYPGAGGYVGCEGGSRCRGTLVVVHAREVAPATTGGVDVGRRPASGVSRPGHVAEDGSIIPKR